MVATIIPGCATELGNSIAHNQDYLSHKRMAASIDQQVNLMDNQDIQMQHIHDWHALQQDADILLNLRDQETIQISRSSVTKMLPSAPIAISKLPKYILASKNGRIELAVVMVPGIFSAAPGKPDLNKLMRTIDLALWRAGVKRCVFETTTDGVYFFWIDSTSSE
jgi:hypothetical protein